jgi:uncharacterized coiled-coil DUF342 family protein
MEQPMNSQNEEIDEDAEAADELDQHGLALHELIQDYLDEHDLPDRMGSLILLSIGIRMRMIGYAMETEKPSESGLKTDLDRFKREIEECIRTAKKGAEEFIEEAKALREEAEAEDEVDDGKGVPS